MVASIGGLNERWLQIAALQRPQAVQPGSGGGPGLGNGGTVTTDLPPISPVASSTASPLSSDTNLLLTMFSGGIQSARSASRANAPTTSAAAQEPSSAASRLQPDAQLSLSDPPVDAAADGITGSTLVQELQALVSSDVRRTSAPSSVPTPPAEPPAGGDAIDNSDTAAPSWRNGWDNTIGPADRGRQQVGLAAYASADFSRQGGGAATVRQGVTA